MDNGWKDKKFIRINHRAIDEGFFKQIRGAVLSVLLVRLLLADDYGNIDFPASWVVRVTGFDPDTVTNADRRLEKLGWLTVNWQKKNGKRRKTEEGTWAKNTARLNLESLPNHLRGVFRKEDRKEFLGTVNKEHSSTVRKNPATEKTPTNSLKKETQYRIRKEKSFKKENYPLENGVLEGDAVYLAEQLGELDKLHWYREVVRKYKRSTWEKALRAVKDFGAKNKAAYFWTTLKSIGGEGDKEFDS